MSAWFFLGGVAVGFVLGLIALFAMILAVKWGQESAEKEFKKQTKPQP